MKAMQKLVRRGAILYVRVTIPEDVRAAYGKREELRSLRTKDESEAKRRGGPIIAEIEERIRALRNPAAPPPVIARQHARMSREEVFAAIQAWRHNEIEGDYRDFWNGEGITLNPESASQLRYLLDDHSRIKDIKTFTARLADVLDVPPDTPFLQKPDVREWWRIAWLEVEQYRDRFSRNDYTGWPEDDDEPAPVPAATPTMTTPVASAGMKLSELRDAWDAVKTLESKQKGYIRRLIEFLGDVDIASVTPIQMDGFLVQLRRFPLTKRPADDKLTFADLIAKYEGTDQSRLSERTVWLWTTVYKAMFEYAVTRRLLTHNPAANMMAKPSQDEPTRLEYSDAELDFVFSRPMFKGFDGTSSRGYREKPGSQIVKDREYWLPILAMHSGMRLEEMATLKVSELVEIDGILAFDLRSRSLTGRARVKNVPSKRLVPLHANLIAIGFAKWAQESRDPEGYIFPGYKFDSRDKRSAQFSKWWGHWSRENAEVKGEGIDHPLLTFHSFRHTFKRAARETIDRDIHDILTGHTDGSVSAGYGRGVSLPVLKEAIDRIKIRWP